MQNLLKQYIREIDENALRQYIDAKAVFTALEAAKKSAFDVRGGMYWRNRNGKGYLISTTREGKKSLGPRSEQTEAIYREFTERKQRIENRLLDLRRALELNRKLNKVYRVGRAPELLVKTLNTLAASDESERVVVMSTYSLYAYEAAAGIRFEHAGALDTEAATCEAGKNRTIHTKDGSIHILSYESFAAQSEKSGVLNGSEKYSAIIVSKTGRMARMHTVSPFAFVAFKRWLAEQPGRESSKRVQDLLQAELVEAMAAEYFPHLQ